MEKQTSNLNNGINKVKLLCSYGGKIQPRPTDHQLSYIGGDTKLLAVDRNIKFSDISAKLMSLCNRIDNSEVSFKYQLPGEDLDALVSLIDDDDVDHMMVEYDRMQRISPKSARLRLFIFDISGPPIPTPKSGLKDPGPGTQSNPDYLFGFDKEYQPSIGPPLDLLQIPGMVLPENYGFGFDGKGGIPESQVTAGIVNGAAAGSGTGHAVYRIPVMVNGGVYQTGQFAYGMVTGMGDGNREQPVYNFIPVTPSVPEMKVNQRNF